MTTDEYLRTDETNLPQELVYGVLRDAAAPTPQHQRVVGNLYWHLRNHVEGAAIGGVWLSAIDVILDDTRHLIVQPDLIVIMQDRLHIVADRVRGAPDIAIEVLSPYPRIGSVHERLGWFEQYGVRECWLVRHLEKRIEVVTFEDGRRTARSVAGSARVPSTVLPAFPATAQELLE